ALEHAPLPLGAQALAGVLDRHLETLRMGFHADSDRAVGGRVAECVGDEVEKHALNLIGCAPGDRILVDPGLKRDSARSRLRLESAQAVVDETGELRLAQVERQRAGVEPGELEQVVDEKSECSNLLLEYRQVVL